MAPPRANGPRRAQQANEHIYTLGERGRKTGVTLRDTGVRDEHGMEPLDSIFSSPAKSQDSDANEGDEVEEEEEEGEEGEEDDEDDDDGGEMDMEITTGGPDPAALLKSQSTASRLAIRQARSPAKSLFGSPAVRAGGSGSAKKPAKPTALRQHQALRPPSSPKEVVEDASSPVKPFKKRLDFGKSVSANGIQKKPALLPGGAAAKQKQRAQEEEEEQEEESILHGDVNGDADESMHMVDEPDEKPEEEPEETEEEEPEPEPEPEPVKPARKRGRPPAKGNSAKATTNGTKSGRPAQASSRKEPTPDQEEAEEAEEEEEEEEEVEEQSSAKRQRIEPKPRGRPRGRPPAKLKQREEGGDEEGEASRPAKTTKESREAAPTEDPKPKKAGRGRPRKSSGVGAAMKAVAAVPRGPPLPKSRGLVIRRRAADDDGGDMQRTRSGRTSYQPLAFWRNEHAEFDGSEVPDLDVRHTQKGSRRRIVLPAIREIYRVEEEDLPPLGRPAAGRRGRPSHAADGKKRRGRRRHGDDGDDDDEEAERQAWEFDPGRVQGAVAVWYPEHELQPPGPDEELEQVDAEIALSSLAMETQDVRDGSFRFIKTLSLPFFGTGVVDLAPGAEKRPKNSRKMHMAFFVHYGQVAVTVNETEFRISKGGMWSVPRGNYYSILNDTDRPARIFFSQGCEVLTVVEPEDDAEAEGDTEVTASGQ